MRQAAALAGTGAAAHHGTEKRSRTMRVVVNQLAALGRRTGIGHYTAELLRCLRQQAPPGSIHVFPNYLTHCAREAWLWLRRRLESGNGAASSAGAGLRGAALVQMRGYGRTFLTRYFKVLCRLKQFDLYHEPNFIPMPSDRPTIATLHDLSVLLHPEWHPADRVAHFERYFREGLERCTHFLAISEYGRQEVIRTLGIPPERVTRTYMGIRPGLAPLPEQEVRAVLARLGLPGQYLLYLGTIEPRKNVLRLLRVYCSLPESLRARWPLLLVGGWGWNTADVAEYLHAQARHRGVVHLGYVADEHVPYLYNGARALVYPSLYEGFGMPPIEMMACGGAVLASTAGALVETVGGQAHLVPAEDDDGWRQALLRVLAEDDWWQSLREGAVEAARPYTWDNCAAVTLRVYRTLCGLPGEEARPEQAIPRRKAG
jgi:alpha-1,3-rhamnosyl/mannosyltransferase